MVVFLGSPRIQGLCLEPLHLFTLVWNNIKDLLLLCDLYQFRPHKHSSSIRTGEYTHSHRTCSAQVVTDASQFPSNCLFSKVEVKTCHSTHEAIVWPSRTLYVNKPGGHIYSVAPGCVLFTFWFYFNSQVVQGTPTTPISNLIWMFSGSLILEQKSYEIPKDN